MMGDISKDFCFKEFFTEGKTVQERISIQIPDIYQRIRMKLVEPILQPMRVSLGIPVIITSGFRSKDYNRQIGGKPHSHHLYIPNDRSAVDIKTTDMLSTWEWLKNHRPFFCYSYWDQTKNFIHISGITESDRRIGLMWIDGPDGRKWVPEHL